MKRARDPIVDMTAKYRRVAPKPEEYEQMNTLTDGELVIVILL